MRIGADLVMLFVMAIDINYDTIMAVMKEKNIKGTVEPIMTKRFKGKAIFIKSEENPTDELVTISILELSIAGLQLFFKGRNDSVYISDDIFEMAIKKA